MTKSILLVYERWTALKDAYIGKLSYIQINPALWRLVVCWWNLVKTLGNSTFRNSPLALKYLRIASPFLVSEVGLCIDRYPSTTIDNITIFFLLPHVHVPRKLNVLSSCSNKPLFFITLFLPIVQKKPVLCSSSHFQPLCLSSFFT